MRQRPPRRHLASAFVSLSLAATLIATTATSASADSVWRVGTEVGKPNTLSGEWQHAYAWSDGYCYSNAMDGYRPSASNVSVKLEGDKVYVFDTCADGKSALGEIKWTANGEDFFRTCRNKYGAGTWAVCDFDWPESAWKYAKGGTYDADAPAGSRTWFTTNGYTYWMGG